MSRCVSHSLGHPYRILIVIISNEVAFIHLRSWMISFLTVSLLEDARNTQWLRHVLFKLRVLLHQRALVLLKCYHWSLWEVGIAMVHSHHMARLLVRVGEVNPSVCHWRSSHPDMLVCLLSWDVVSISLSSICSILLLLMLLLLLIEGISSFVLFVG
jgi:hypothetical protein